MFKLRKSILIQVVGTRTRTLSLARSVGCFLSVPVALSRISYLYAEGRTYLRRMMADLCGAASLPPTPLYAAPTLSTPTRSQAKLSEERTDWTVKRLPTCAPMVCHSSNTIEVARASANNEELAYKGSRTQTHTETCAARRIGCSATRRGIP